MFINLAALPCHWCLRVCMIDSKGSSKLLIQVACYMKCVDTVVIFYISRKIIEYLEVQNSWQNGMSRSDDVVS